MRRTAKYSENKAVQAIISALYGMVATLFCLVAFSLVMTYVDLPQGIVSALANISLCLGSYFAGFISAKKSRRHGIAIGAASGLAVFLIALLIHIIFVHNGITNAIFSKFAMIMVCSIIGGIIGVNSKGKNY